MLKQRRNELAKTALVAAVIAVVGTVYLLAILNAVPPHPDLDIYIRGARDLAAGRSLYDGFLHGSGDPTVRYGFIYPPPFGMLLWPLSLIPAAVAPAVWLVAMHAALIVAFVLVFRRLAAPRQTVLLAIAITLAFYPLWVEGSQAQANLAILLLVALGILGVTRGKERSAIWLGLAAALKLTPALLLIWLLWERRFKAAAWMAGGFAALTGIAAIVRPADTATYLTKVLPMLAGGTAYYSNQSLAGVAARLLTANPYTTPLAQIGWGNLVVLALAGAALGYWLWASRRIRSDLGRALSFLPLLPLLSTVSWEHHLVILLPLVWITVAAPTLPSPVNGGGKVWPRVVFGLGVVCLVAIPHLPIGPPYSTDFARAAHTANPVLIVSANRLLLGTLILFLSAPWLLARQSSLNSIVAPQWPWKAPTLTLPRKQGRESPLGGMSSSSELDRPA